MPAVPAAGVPPSRPDVALNATPLGNAPETENVGAGDPVAVTVNDPANPIVNRVLFTLVIAGRRFTVRVKLWLELGSTPFCAVIVRG